MNSVADNSGLNLNGAGVLITRPIEQSAGIEALVNTHGGNPYVFPCLEITLRPFARLSASLSQVQAGDVLIFVSCNAVRGVFHNISNALRYQLASAQIAAVGVRTQAALVAEKLFVAISPDSKHQHSEGLLRHPLLQDLTGRHVFIVRGQSGRETLGETLVERGAKLDYIRAYTRTIPQNYDRVSLLEAFQAGRIQTILLTSFAAFENLCQMLGDNAVPVLKDLQLVVPGARVAQKIRAHYSFPVSEARNASDKEMLAATKPL